MKIFTVSTIAILGTVLAATAADAHGRVVTGSELYASQAQAQPTSTRDHLVGKSDNAIQSREFRAVQHDTHWLRDGDPY